jgi:hypothetical protein
MKKASRTNWSNFFGIATTLALKSALFHVRKGGVVIPHFCSQLRLQAILGPQPRDWFRDLTFENRVPAHAQPNRAWSAASFSGATRPLPMLDSNGRVAPLKSATLLALPGGLSGLSRSGS